MRKIAELVAALEEAGCEINSLEWNGRNMNIDVTPMDKAIPVFTKFGYLEETEK